MDRELIEEKLEALRYCVQRIENKCPREAKQLAQDADLQDIVAINLVKAVQPSVDIAAPILADSDARTPDTMAEAFEQLKEIGVLGEDTADRMQKAVGFRNIAVHAYEKIDWTVCTESAASGLRISSASRKPWSGQQTVRRQTSSVLFQAGAAFHLASIF